MSIQAEAGRPDSMASDWGGGAPAGGMMLRGTTGLSWPM
jgi:hypothetical protein